MRRALLFLIVASFAFLLMTGCSEQPYDIAKNSLKIEEESFERLREVVQTAENDAKGLGYEVNVVSLPDPRVIYQDGKMVGAYFVRAATKSLKDPKEDVTIWYYFSAEKELMVRMPIGENQELYDKYEIRPENLAF
ncbi:hypothetical protein NDK47_02805 [Brevibacillus ruminantium]|uniref:Lipoprotein n=1 Tax=Brevibacillus ruminantium TaxID=2950604 RepID=A0ABY4WHD8_9BACL|nr:hypothetical protein [Brevibacillus ruminantium]USG66279.1 hypothetical protein NDK47_02805 [Brevibacillus ruminantium]